MLCAERDLLRLEHLAAVQNFRASFRDLVALVDNSAADINFSLVQRRIRAARRACDMTQDALSRHQAEHGCQNLSGVYIG
jgi:hypothetical protein